ncbi:MAG: hypothetical protein QXU18_07030 [Thermoplasmatales archaeon]
MNAFQYEFPNEIELNNGQRLTLSANERKDEKYFAVVVSPEKISEVVSVLRGDGFTNAWPAWNKGEAYSLSKVIDEPWEMHVRIYSDGSIYSHVEVRRDYIEHLDTRYIWPLIDEITGYVQRVTDAFMIVHTRTKQLVKRVISKVRVRISPPTSKTEWKPAVEVIGVIAVTALVTYGIVKLIDYLNGEMEED